MRIELDPVALDLGLVQIHWYGVMYLLAFASAYFLGVVRAKENPDWAKAQVADLIFYGALGAVLGGRIGYVLFYGFSAFLADPLTIFKVWQGGMSFHGGMLGVTIAAVIFAHRQKKNFFEVADFAAPLVPIGLGFGRFANFINGELWGKPTDSFVGMIFPRTDPLELTRHPSMLYEMFLEGLILFVMVWWFSKKPRPRGAISGLWLLLYGVFRFMVEFVRLPDGHIGYLAWNWLTMGQILSLPMIFAGIILAVWAYKKI